MPVRCIFKKKREVDSANASGTQTKKKKESSYDTNRFIYFQFIELKEFRVNTCTLSFFFENLVVLV